MMIEAVGGAISLSRTSVFMLRTTYVAPAERLDKQARRAKTIAEKEAAADPEAAAAPADKLFLGFSSEPQ